MTRGNERQKERNDIKDKRRNKKKKDKRGERRGEEKRRGEKSRGFPVNSVRIPEVYEGFEVK